MEKDLKANFFLSCIFQKTKKYNKDCVFFSGDHLKNTMISIIFIIQTALPILGMMMFGKKRRRKRSTKVEDLDQDNSFDDLANDIINHIQDFHKKIENWDEK